jgi:hypothetical protein
MDICERFVRGNALCAEIADGAQRFKAATTNLQAHSYLISCSSHTSGTTVASLLAPAFIGSAPPLRWAMQAPPPRHSIRHYSLHSTTCIHFFGFFPILGYVADTLLPLSADDNLATKGVLIACGTLRRHLCGLSTHAVSGVHVVRSADKTCSGARNPLHPLHVIIEPIFRLSQDTSRGVQAGLHGQFKAERKQMVEWDL